MIVTDKSSLGGATVKITTKSGSKYTVETEDGKDFRLTAENKPNDGMQSLAGETYKIGQPYPWPPYVGAPILFVLHKDAEQEYLSAPSKSDWIRTSRVVEVKLTDKVAA